MPDTTDPAASALDGIRKRLDGLDAIRLRRHSMAEESVNLKLHAVTEDFRRLLAAVEAALAFHEEFDGTCGSCCDAYGEAVAWPCEEFTDITAALTGKEAGNGR